MPIKKYPDPGTGGGGGADNLGNHTATQDLDMGSNDITNVGNVDGRDVSTDGTNLDNHLDGTANQHDASEIDVEGTYTHAPSSPTDLETVISELSSAIPVNGSGIILTEDTTTSSSSTSSTTFVDTPLAITINTIANEKVLISFTGDGIMTAGTPPGTAVFGIRVDSGSDEEICTHTPAANGRTGDMSFARALTFSAGAHTITLRQRVSSGDTGGLYASATRIAKLQALQYRGDLIPVQEEDTTIVSEPSALNFTGEVTVTQDGTVADVEIDLQIPYMIALG